MQIQIPDKLGAWLQQMAAQAGKLPDAYAIEVLIAGLEDREDYLLALEGLRSVELEGTVSLQEGMRELDLEHRVEQAGSAAVERAG